MSSLAPLRHHTLDELFELCNRGFGASTGYMEEQRGNWSHLVASAGRMSHRVLELSALSGSELPALIGFLKTTPVLGFDYVSVHGPAKGWSGSSAELAARLRSDLPAYIDAVVLHPDSLEDVAPFVVLGDLPILENMDAFKPSARSVEELRPYFETLPKAGFCFDIAHARMNDPSMELGHELVEAFGDRLREVHLSSITDDGRHVPLTQADVEAFWPVLERCREVPWVLEAELPRDQKIA